MLRIRRNLCLAIATSLTGAPAWAAQKRVANTQPSNNVVPPAVADAILASGLSPKSFGMFAQEVEGNRTLVKLNEEQPYTMASTTKIVTSLAALDLLGPYYRWHTSAYAMGPLVNGTLHGDLLIVGGGNAQLTSPELQAWFGRMREQGLQEIEGDIVLDRFAFLLSAADHAHTPVQSADHPRHVWPDAMTLDEGLLSVSLQPAKNGMPLLALRPALSDVRIVNQVTTGGGCDASARWENKRNGEADVVVRGNWGVGCGNRTISFVPRPTAVMRRVRWRRCGRPAAAYCAARSSLRIGRSAALPCRPAPTVSR